MIVGISFVLEKIAEAILSNLVEKVGSELQKKLKGDPSKIALQQALGAAIRRYATSMHRLDLARPLLEKDSFLTLPIVAQELAQLMRFEREPDAHLIGEKWKASIDAPPPWCDFTSEARRLLEYIQVELLSTDVFRPVFEAKSLKAITASIDASARSLSRIESQLTDLTQLMSTQFLDLTRVFAGASLTMRESIRDYTRFLQEKTHDFVGRQFVFDAITRFVTAQPCGYFVIRGDPGIGKSALAAQLVRTHGYVHHFNIRSEGINRTETFLRNICAQIIVVYQLNHSFLPPDATQDAGFLKQLLEEVSTALSLSEKALIVVDALDEVETNKHPSGVNLLYLPVTLPQSVYMILTLRRTPLPLRIDSPVNTLDLESDSQGNIADIQEYVKRTVSRSGIQAYIAAQGIDEELFIEHVVEKSEGNFMYLHYVLPEIEHGAYTTLDLGTLPAGLQNYYEDHWQRMRNKDEDQWFDYQLPIIMALTQVKVPVSIDLIADFSGIQERARIREVLREWAQFLHEEQVLYENGLQKRYHIYHASFHEFIAQKEVVADERVSRRGAGTKIADTLWKDLYGPG